MGSSENSEKDGGNKSGSNQGSGEHHGQNPTNGFFSSDTLEIGAAFILFVFSGAFHIAGGWFHILGFICDFLIIWCGITIITHHADERTFKIFGLRYWLSLCAAFIVIASLAIFVVCKEERENPAPGPMPPQPAFRVTLTNRFPEPDGSNPCYLWWVFGSNASNAMAWPVDVLMHIQFTNLKPTDMMIDEYSIETEIGNNVWVTVPPISPRSGVFYWAGGGTNFQNAGHMDFGSEYFDLLIDNKNIAPNETVQGWIFLMAPNGSPENNVNNVLRLRVKDSLGNEYVEPFSFFGPSSPPGMSYNQMASVNVIGHVDISQIKRTRFTHLTSAPSLSQKAETTRTIEQEVTYYSRMASARQWQPPEIPPGLGDMPGGVGGKMVSIKIGGNIFVAGVGTNGWFDSIPFAGPAGEDFTPYIQNNRVYIKVKTLFGTTEQTVEMNAEWPTNIPNGWNGDRNFNANSFEIVDESTQPVLQVRYDSPNVIEINGIFVGPDGAITIAFGGDLTQQIAGYPIPVIPERKAWFQYPSKDHLGELANQ